MAVPAVGAAKMIGGAIGQVGIQLALENAFFNKEVQQTTKQAESAFSKSFKKIGGFAKSAFNNIKNTISTSLATSTKIMKNVFSDTLNKVKSKFSDTFNKIGRIMKRALLVGSILIVKFGKDAIQAASDTQSAWTGLLSIVNGTGKSFSEAQGFLNEYVSDGLVPLTDAVTAYKTLAARGYETEQIEGIMTSLKDAAAFNRQSSYSYGEAIKSAAEGLKNENSILVDNAGVTKNVSVMWQEYAESIGTTADKLTLAQKRTAEYNGILAETKFQQGDAAKYADTYAGKLAKLNTAFFNLKVTVGQVLAPFVELLLPAITAAINGLTKMLNKLKSIMAVFGLEMKEYVGGGTTTAINSATESAGGLSSGLDSAGTAGEKAAKKIKRAFSGIDEINVLNTSDASSGSNGSSGAGGTGGAGGDLDTGIGGGFEETQETVKQNLDWLKRSAFDWGVAFGEAINNGLNKIPWDTIQSATVNAMSKVAEFLNGAVEGLDWHLLGSTFGEGFNTVIYGLNTFYKEFDWANLGKGLGEGINGIFDSVDWKTLGEYLGRKFSSTFQVLSNMFDEMNWTEIGRKLGISLQSLFNNIDWEAVGKTFSNGLNGVSRALFNFTSMVDWKGLGKDIYDTLSNTIKTIDWQGIGITLGTLWNDIFSVLGETIGKKEFWDNLGDEIILGVNSTLETVDWKATGKAVSNFVTGITGFIADALKEINWEKAFDEFLNGVDLAQILADILEIKFELKKMKWQAIGKVIVDGIFDGIKLYFTSAIEGMGKFIDEHFIQPWKKAFDTKGKTWTEIGADIIGGILKGIEGVLKAPYQLMKEFVFDPIVGGIKAVFGIASPSKEMEPIGGYIVEGMLNGIKNAMGTIIEWLYENVLEPILTWFDDTFGTDFASSVEKAIDNAFGDNTKKKVTDSKNKLITWWGDFKLEVKTNFATTKKNVTDWWGNVKTWWSGKKDSITKTLNVASKNTTDKKQVTNWWSNIKTWWSGKKDSITKTLNVASKNTTTKDQVTKWWSTIKNWWSTKKLNIGSSNTTTKQQVSNWWNSIKSWWGNKTLTLKAKIGEVTGSIKSWFNNNLIKPLNNKLPSFIPKIPYLAQGGWLAANNPQLAVVGDNKHEGEIISPESKIKEQVVKGLQEAGTNIKNQLIDLRIKLEYPDGKYLIREINNTQIKDGYVSLLV